MVHPVYVSFTGINDDRYGVAMLSISSGIIGHCNRLFTIQFYCESWLLSWSVNNEDFQ